VVEFGGLGMPFNIRRGTIGSLAKFTAIRPAPHLELLRREMRRTIDNGQHQLQMLGGCRSLPAAYFLKHAGAAQSMASAASFVF